MESSEIQITGITSLYVVKYGSVHYYFMGDQHFSGDIGSCQSYNKNLTCDSINRKFNDVIIRDTNCWSVGALLSEWFEYNYDNKIYTDFYIEIPYTKSDERKRGSDMVDLINQRRSPTKNKDMTLMTSLFNIKEDKDDIEDPLVSRAGWIPALSLLFKDCLTADKKFCKYNPIIRLHYADTRQFDLGKQFGKEIGSDLLTNFFLLQDYADPILMQLSQTLNNISLGNVKSKTDFIVENIWDFVNFSKVVVNNAHLIHNEIYMGTYSVDEILDSYKKWLDPNTIIGDIFHSKINKMMKLYTTRTIELFPEHNKQGENIYVENVLLHKTAAEFNKLRQQHPDIAEQLWSFVHHVIEETSLLALDGIENFETKLVALVHDNDINNDPFGSVVLLEKLENFIPNLLAEIAGSLVPISALDMDIYTISRMILQSPTSDVIAFAGAAHIAHYASFFVDYLGGNLIYRHDFEMDNRCVTIDRSMLPINPYNFRNHILTKRKPVEITQSDKERRRKEILARYSKLESAANIPQAVIPITQPSIPHRNRNQPKSPVKFTQADLRPGYSPLAFKMRPNPETKRISRILTLEAQKELGGKKEYKQQTRKPQAQEKLQKEHHDKKVVKRNPNINVPSSENVKDVIKVPQRDTPQIQGPPKQIPQIQVPQRQTPQIEIPQRQSEVFGKNQPIKIPQVQPIKIPQVQIPDAIKEEIIIPQREPSYQIGQLPPQITPDMTEAEKREVRRRRAAIIAAQYNK